MRLKLYVRLNKKQVKTKENKLYTMAEIVSQLDGTKSAIGSVKENFNKSCICNSVPYEAASIRNVLVSTKY